MVLAGRSGAVVVVLLLDVSSVVGVLVVRVVAARDEAQRQREAERDPPSCHRAGP